MSRDLVVFSLEAWDDIWRRNQYLIDGLLHRDPGLRVLFVEPSNDVLHTLLAGRRVSASRGLRAADGYDGRLQLLQPHKVVPRSAGPGADALLRRSVRTAVARLGFASPVAWINDPGWAHILPATGWPAVYDMTDDWLAADRSEREHDRLVRNESILMTRSAAVVVCSTGLQASRRRLRDVVLIPNAVDVERYRRPVERPEDLPAHSALYVGTLHEDRLDVDLLMRTADAVETAGGVVVLVGPSALSAGNAARVTGHPAVRMLGPRPSADIPAYLQHADVLIVPHVVDEFTDSLDPIKLYEYQAVGRPIVSTPVSGFRDAVGVTVGLGTSFVDAAVQASGGSVGAALGLDVPDWSTRVSDYEVVLRPLFPR
jgi:teichuronic acid biosynthesis glycosyltransferase TuaH